MRPEVSGPSELAQLRRETRTGLELAIVSLAPNDLLDRLATVTGLLQALAELPADSPQAMALLPATIDRATSALGAWRSWYEARGRRA